MLTLLMTLLALAPLPSNIGTLHESGQPNGTAGGFEPVATWRAGHGNSASITKDGRWVKIDDKVYQTEDLSLVAEAPGVISKDGSRSFRAPKGRDKAGYYELPSGKEIPLEIQGLETRAQVLWDRGQFLYLYRNQAKPAKSGKNRSQSSPSRSGTSRSRRRSRNTRSPRTS